MLVLLWSLQGILCALFLLVGSLKMSLPKDKLLKSMPVYENVPINLVRLLGLLELLAALGIILPTLLNIAPFLTLITAVILTMGMFGAIIVHMSRREYKQIILPVILFLAALTVAILRF